MVTLETHKEAIVGVKWHPLNNAQVATVSWDSTIILWDLETAGCFLFFNSYFNFRNRSL